MPFHYEALDAESKTHTGKIETQDREAALQQLKDQNLYVISLYDEDAVRAQQKPRWYHRFIPWSTAKVGACVECGVLTSHKKDSLFDDGVDQFDWCCYPCQEKALEQWEQEHEEERAAVLNEEQEAEDRRMIDLIKRAMHEFQNERDAEEGRRRAEKFRLLGPG